MRVAALPYKRVEPSDAERCHMIHPRKGLTGLLVVCACSSSSMASDTPGTPEATPVYRAAYFSQFQPLTALDIIRHLPGFTIRSGDTDLRGYSGATGNVLVDGQRPTGKEEGIEDLLRRIPAGTVDHVELIRSGNAEYDMQDYALVANVVRKRDSSMSGQLKIENAVHDIGGHSPRLSGEVSLNARHQTLDLSGALYRDIDDEKGHGTRNRYDRNGTPLKLASYSEPEIDSVKEFAAKYRRALWGGTLRLTGLIKDENEETDTENTVSFPEPALSATSERDESRSLEFDINYERPLGPDRKLELLGFHRFVDTSASERSVDMEDTAFATEKARATETIVRGLYRQKLGAATLESGIEAAWNVLDSQAALQENGTIIDLPASSVRVSEQRMEFFAASVFQISPSVTLDTGIRYESSTLEQTGDSESSRRFSFLKPRALLSWKPGTYSEIRFLAEREVGQLDFEDFISTTSLSEETITAGNQELRPESLWRLGLAWEQRFHDAKLTLSFRHEAIQDVIDHIPLTAGSEVFDSVGNIEGGIRDELELNLNFPMASIGLENLTLQADTVLRKSSVKDPMTSENRRISEDIPLEGRIQITYDLPETHMRFGASFTFNEKESSFELNEIKTDRKSERLNLFAEYKPTARWAIRAFANNLTNGPAETRRSVYTGPRNTTTTDYLDIKSLRGGRAFGVSVEWLFP